MSEKIWYFAQGDTEQGPLTESRIRSMATSGLLRPDDLVWREGMKQWVPAREVPELFQPPSGSSTDTGSTPDVPIPVQPRQPQPTSVRRPVEILAHARVVGQPLLLVGLILVLSARGCDGIHARYIEHVEAIADVQEPQFQDSWNDQIKRRSDELTKLQNKKGRSGADNQRMQQLTQEITKINRDYSKQRTELKAGKWDKQKRAARDARAGYKMWGWWRETMFVFGTIGLTIGLLAVGFSGSGPERWICLIMIAIITFSVYVGGIAWVARLIK